MTHLHLAVSNSYPKRPLSNEALEHLSSIQALRVELFQQTELLEQSLQQTIDDEWLFQIMDFDYPNARNAFTLSDGQRLVAKLFRDIGLDNE